MPMVRSAMVGALNARAARTVTHFLGHIHRDLGHTRCPIGARDAANTAPAAPRPKATPARNEYSRAVHRSRQKSLRRKDRAKAAGRALRQAAYLICISSKRHRVAVRRRGRINAGRSCRLPRAGLRAAALGRFLVRHRSQEAADCHGAHRTSDAKVGKGGRGRRAPWSSQTSTPVGKPLQHPPACVQGWHHAFGRVRYRRRPFDVRSLAFEPLRALASHRRKTPAAPDPKGQRASRQSAWLCR